MNRAQRRMREQFRKQLEEERNGKPIDPEIAARMTKPRMTDELHQVMITVRGSGKVVSLGPMMNKDACGMCCEAINKQIIGGQRGDWTKAEVYPMTRIREGVI